MYSKLSSLPNQISSTNSISNADEIPYLCCGGGFINCKKTVGQCVELCYRGDSKSAVIKLNDCMEKYKDELRITKYNKGGIDLFLTYKEAALVYTFSYMNSQAKSCIKKAKKLSQNFQFYGNEVHFIHVYNLCSEIQVRNGEIEEAEASIKQTAEFIEAYEPLAITSENREFVIRSRSWNQLHKALVFLERKNFPEAENQIALTIQGFEQVSVERLVALAMEVEVRIYIEWAKIDPIKLYQAEKLCNEILHINFVQQNHFYVKGRIMHHLAKIYMIRRKLSKAKDFCAEAKVQYEFSLPQESELVTLVTDLTSEIEKDLYDLYCDELSLNELPEAIEG